MSRSWAQIYDYFSVHVPRNSAFFYLLPRTLDGGVAIGIGRSCSALGRCMTVVVFFGAHADDVELGAGGTCAKLCDAGLDVHIVLATDEADPTVASRRREEQRAAAAVMGVPCDRVHFVGLPDGDVRCSRKAVGHLRGMMAALGLSPAAVFVHTEADSHRDHVELSRLVRSTFRRLPIFHYAVRNSSVVSRFRPNVFSQTDAFNAVKDKALACHRSQVAAGRVPMDQVRAFAKRFTLGIEGGSLEPFELEVQEGCIPDPDVLDLVNDVPFSRLWLPLLRHGSVVLHEELPQEIPGQGWSRAPWPLATLTRLHADLLKMSCGYGADASSPLLEIAPADGRRAPWQPGVNLVFGNPLLSPLSSELASMAGKTRWAFEVARDRAEAVIIRDREAKQRLCPPALSAHPIGAADGVDYGLITMVRRSTGGNGRDGRGPATFVIGLGGMTGAGIAAACACLLEPDAISRIVAGARQVAAGQADGMQWLVPCDAVGRPMVARISAASTGRRRPVAAVQTAAVATDAAA